MSFRAAFLLSALCALALISSSLGHPTSQPDDRAVAKVNVEKARSCFFCS